MSTNCFTNIHVRDFVNEVARDPTRPGYDSALQLHSNVHVPSVQGEELSDDFDCRNITGEFTVSEDGSNVWIKSILPAILPAITRRTAATNWIILARMG
jgi:hypothetical protein